VSLAREKALRSVQLQWVTKYVVEFLFQNKIVLWYQVSGKPGLQLEGHHVLMSLIPLLPSCPAISLMLIQESYADELLGNVFYG
jgi:hypothetical protein